MEPTNTFLLTGAGFTKSFGGYLGSEMWAAILNQPELQGDIQLRRPMVEHRDLNFEAVYYDVQNSSEFDSEQKTALTRAVRRAYRQMDEILRESAGMKAASACRGFIRRFAGSRAKRTLGFVFTLNQDQLVERFYWNADAEQLIGIPALHSPEWFKGCVGPLFGHSDDDELPLPSEEKVTEERTNFWNTFGRQLAYVKLHGSFGWRSQDGSNVMVIGHEKLGSINKEPLLKWYLSLFENLLNAGQRKLLVVGYGFRDKHINEIIANALKHHQLQIYIVSPKQPIDFRSELFSVPKPRYNITEIWNSISGYFPGTVHDFYELGHDNVPPQAKSFLSVLGI